MEVERRRETRGRCCHWLWSVMWRLRGTARSARMMLLSSLVVVVKTERYICAADVVVVVVVKPVVVERLK